MIRSSVIRPFHGNSMWGVLVTMLIAGFAAATEEKPPQPVSLVLVDSQQKPVEGVVQLGSRGFRESIGQGRWWVTKLGRTQVVADSNQVLVAWGEDRIPTPKSIHQLLEEDKALEFRWALPTAQAKRSERIQPLAALKFTVKVTKEQGRQAIEIIVTNPTNNRLTLPADGWVLTSNRHRVLIDTQVPTHQLAIDGGAEVMMRLDWFDVVRRSVWLSRQAGPVTGELVLPSHPHDDFEHFQFDLGGAHQELIGLAQPEVLLDQLKSVTSKLVFDKPEFFIGENILAHIMLTNTSSTPVSIELGGDYRGAPRALRFKVEVTDQNGKMMLDPTPHPMCMGGLGGSQELKPNAPYWLSIPLLRYREMPKPGLYQVKVFHDLGWESCPSWDCTEGNEIPKDRHLAPVAAATVRVKQPSPKQAFEVIQTQRDLPPNNGYSWGQRHQPFADFSLLRDPIYLPALQLWVRETSQETDVEAEIDDGRLPKHSSAAPLAAIGGIATVPATQMLIEFLHHKNSHIAAGALDQLLMRLPYPYLNERKEWAAYGEMLRRAETSWNPKFREPLLEFALELVRTGAGPDHNFDNSTAERRRQHQMLGARMLQAVVRRSDYPQLREQLDEVLRAYLDVANEQHDYPRPASLTAPFLDALYYAATDGQTLLEGHAINAPVGAASQQLPQPLDDLTTARLIRMYPDVRPHDWTSRLRKALASDVPWVRVVTMTAIVARDPASTDPAIRQAVIANLAHSSDAVQAEAVHVAQRAPHADYLPALRKLHQTTKNQFLPGEAETAIKACEQKK